MRANALSKDAAARLAKSKDYREFLRLAFRLAEEPGKRGGQARAARKAGLSRSYLSEVISGKKGLSRDSMQRIKSGLKLRGAAARFFEFLVMDEQPKLFPMKARGAISPSARKKLIHELLQENEETRGIAEKNVRRPEVFQVFAALGSEESGASLRQVADRTGLSLRVSQSALNVLVNAGAADKREGRFFAKFAKADALRMKDTEAVSEMVRRVCANIQKSSNRIVEDERSLNVYSAFSVRREKISALKESLEQAIFSVLDDFQDDEGESVEQVFVSLFRRPLDRL